MTVNAWIGGSHQELVYVLMTCRVPTLTELDDSDDDELFQKVLDNPYHVLRNILPNETVWSMDSVSKPVIV